MKKNNNFCTIYFVRHGESEANVKKILIGHTDVFLTENGKIQAKELSQKLKDINFDAVFSSDLLRAKNTAEIISENRELAVQTTHLIRERNFGIYEGKKTEEYLKEIELMKEKLGKLGGIKQNFQCLPSVEDDEELMQRTILFLREIAVAYSGKIILVVSHGGLLRNFLIHIGFATAKELPSGSIKNTALIKLFTDGVEFIVKETQGVNKVLNSN